MYVCKAGRADQTAHLLAEVEQPDPERQRVGGKSLQRNQRQCHEQKAQAESSQKQRKGQVRPIRCRSSNRTGATWLRRRAGCQAEQV